MREVGRKKGSEKATKEGKEGGNVIDFQQADKSRLVKPALYHPPLVSQMCYVNHFKRESDYSDLFEYLLHYIAHTIIIKWHKFHFL